MATAMQKKMALVRAGKKHGHKKISGTAVGATKKTARKSGGAKVVIMGPAKKKRRVGASRATGGKVQQVIVTAAGIGLGAGITHVILRPIEHKITEKNPGLAKYMGAAEIGVGGAVFLGSKNLFIKMVGLGIMAGGVQTVMHQLPIGMPSPAAAINGGGEAFTTVLPMGNVLNNNMAVSTPIVGRTVLNNNSNSAVHTPVVGIYDEETGESYDLPKGMGL